jgi:very-short-patch-repair endonuclease
MPTFPSHLRINSTDAEKHLWQALRNRQLQDCKFRRQHPIPPYVVDFVCLEHRLIVELDGGQHAEALAYDAARTTFLERQGYRVLRFWNNEFLQSQQAVLETILQALSNPQPEGAQK